MFDILSAALFAQDLAKQNPKFVLKMDTKASRTDSTSQLIFLNGKKIKVTNLEAKESTHQEQSVAEIKCDLFRTSLSSVFVTICQLICAGIFVQIRAERASVSLPLLCGQS